MCHVESFLIFRLLETDLVLTASYKSGGMCTVQHSLGRKEMFYLTTHSTHFIYGYMASHIW